MLTLRLTHVMEVIVNKEKIKKIKKRCESLDVLYVEDDLEVRNQTQKMLSVYFRNVVCAIDGKEACELYGKHNIDIIFTDINMPNVDGLSLIETIRKTNKNIPIVVFSAYDKPEYLLKTIQLGVQGYLIKPFTLKDIIEILDKIISSINDKINLVIIKDGYYWDQNLEKLFHKKYGEIKLTKHELTLIKMFVGSKKQIFSSDTIEIEVFNDNISDNKRVRNLISRLKNKLKSNLIENIYGEGYRISWETD